MRLALWLLVALLAGGASAAAAEPEPPWNSQVLDEVLDAQDAEARAAEEAAAAQAALAADPGSAPGPRGIFVPGPTAPPVPGEGSEVSAPAQGAPFPVADGAAAIAILFGGASGALAIVRWRRERLLLPAGPLPGRVAACIVLAMRPWRPM